MTLEQTYKKWLSLQPLSERQQRKGRQVARCGSLY